MWYLNQKRANHATVAKSPSLHLEIVAVPAPRTLRPLAGIPNPYPYGCSVLCNHPRDPELRDVVWRSKVLSSDLNESPHINRREKSKGLTHGSPSDEDLIFPKWPHQPFSPSSVATTARRCATPDERYRRSYKESDFLIVDLRRCRSYQDLSWSTTERASDDVADLERFELTSPKPSGDARSKSIRRPETVPFKFTSREAEWMERTSSCCIQWFVELVEEMVADSSLSVVGVAYVFLTSFQTNRRVRPSFKFKRKLRRRNQDAPEVPVVPSGQVSPAKESDVESDVSDSSPAIQPLTWVDIKPKPVEKAPQLTPNVSRETRKPNWSLSAAKTTGFTGAFHNFVLRSYSLMAEVEDAKQRVYSNQVITKVEENIDWRSEAPRPMSPSFAAVRQIRSMAGKKAKDAEKVPAVIDLFPALRIVRLRGQVRPESPPKKTAKKPKRKTRRKPKTAAKSGNLAEKHVTFQLPPEATNSEPNRKISKKKRTKKRRSSGKANGPKMSSPSIAASVRGINMTDSVFSGFQGRKAAASRSSSKGKGPTHRKPTSPIAHERDNRPVRGQTVEESEVIDDPATGTDRDAADHGPLLKIEAAQEDCIQISRATKSEDRLAVDQQETEDLGEAAPAPSARPQEDPSLEDLLNILKQNSLTDDEAKRLEEGSWLRFPRAGDTFGTRCQLPFDLRLLKNMTPLEYLSRYIVPTRCRKRLNDTVFDRHSDGDALPIQGLMDALTEILGFRMDPESEKELSSLTAIDVDRLDREQLAGVGALAERLCRRGVSRRQDLEVADFSLFEAKLANLDLNEPLRRLMSFISST